MQVSRNSQLLGFFQRWFGVTDNLGHKLPAVSPFEQVFLAVLLNHVLLDCSIVLLKQSATNRTQQVFRNPLDLVFRLQHAHAQFWKRIPLALALVLCMLLLVFVVFKRNNFLLFRHVVQPTYPSAELVELGHWVFYFILLGLSKRDRQSTNLASYLLFNQKLIQVFCKAREVFRVIVSLNLIDQTFKVALKLA
jgi:hypothetical protein